MKPDGIIFNLILENPIKINFFQLNLRSDLNFNKLGENIEKATINLSVISSGINLSPLSSLLKQF